MRIAKSKLRKNRRYYLHGKVKKICKIDAIKRTIFSVNDLDILKTNKYISELVNDFGYSLQLEIPQQ